MAKVAVTRREIIYNNEKFFISHNS